MAGALAANAGLNRSIPSTSPEASIRAENSQQNEGFDGRGLFSDAQDYQRICARLDRVAANYKGTAWPEEGAIKETVSLAAIAKSGPNRAAFLREAAQFAVILIDRMGERATLQ